MRRRPAVLPNDGRRHWLACLAVPQHRGLALVGQANRTQLRGRDARPKQDFLQHRQLGLPDFIGIVLDPSGLRKMLRKFTLRDRHRLASPIKHHRT